jgi:hypothetical protein
MKKEDYIWCVGIVLVFFPTLAVFIVSCNALNDHPEYRTILLELQFAFWSTWIGTAMINKAWHMRLRDKSMSARLTYRLNWLGGPVGSAEVVTWGDLTIQLDDTVLWGTGGSGVRWSWVELLEHLTESWRWLRSDDTWPGPMSTNPIGFYGRAIANMCGRPAAEAEAMEDAIQEFRLRHDLAMGVHGKFLPMLWVIRSGNNAWVIGGGRSELLTFSEVETFLRSLGQTIAERLRSSKDDRARSAIASWWKRLEGTAASNEVIASVE